jgi:hypothetical protein
MLATNASITTVALNPRARFNPHLPNTRIFTFLTLHACLQTAHTTVSARWGGNGKRRRQLPRCAWRVRVSANCSIPVVPRRV